MSLLQRIQATFSGWGITTDLIPNAPSWAKSLQQVIKDSGNYKVISNNWHTIGLTGLAGTISIKILLIASDYFKEKKPEQSNPTLEDQLKTSQGNVERLTKEPEQARSELKTQKTTSQQIEERLSNEVEKVRFALMTQKTKSQENIEQLTKELEQTKLKGQHFQKIQTMPKANNFSILNGVKNEQDKHEATKKLLEAEKKKSADLEKKIADLEKEVHGSFSGVEFFG